jgi:hypothetical protein
MVNLHLLIQRLKSSLHMRILGYDLGQSCCEHAFWTISDCPLCSTAPPVGSESSKPVTNQIMFYIGMAIWSLYLLSTVW